jgi:GH15 family glucan-1,4-alpha-glucosidase
MARIEDYALLGDTHSAGLVSLDGSIDWLCLPRFDSGAIFAALLDEDRGGRWRIAPEGEFSSRRHYRNHTLVLETVFETPTGTAAVVDCLPIEEHSDPRLPRQVFPHEVVVRIVRGLERSVGLSMLYEPRFDYGYVAPWLRYQADGIESIGGPDAFMLRAQVPLHIDEHSVTAAFEVGHGDSVAFIAAYRPSHIIPETPVAPEDSDHLVEVTTDYWQRWAARCSYDGPWREEIIRSLLTLKALTYSPTGGIVAAPTTSLPESLGGVRNWDYRYCWLRDATFTLDVLLDQGYTAEAQEWRSWLRRAVAGDPEDLQIMYGVRGERRLTEYELGWLHGYEGSSPVRVGNGAHAQFQLDVYGEVMDSFHSARRAGLETDDQAWGLEQNIVEFVCEHWDEPDGGIWEVRSGREHFVHSKVMAWVAVDRGIAAVERWGKVGPLDRWKEVRGDICAQILEQGYNPERGTFVRSYGSIDLDAALLMMPLVVFLPAADPRMHRTIDAIAQELVSDGLVLRYRSSEASDGLPAGEGTFLMCTFWLADCYVLLGRHREARTLFERLLGLCNDVGLLAEQYDAQAGRLVGNFPQAFSHTGLVTTAAALTEEIDPATRMNRAR